jgi:DNA polymerase IV
MPRAGRLDGGSTSGSQSLAGATVSWLWGAGPKTQTRLFQIGLRTIGEVAEADPDFLFVKLGKVGLHFHALANAEDSRPVIGGRSSKSIGSERTLEKDVCGKSDIKVHLRRSAEVIGRRLRQKRNVAYGVGIKLKTSNFQIFTRQRRLSEPTDVTQMLYSVAVDLLNDFDHPGPFRLVGVVAYDLVGVDDRSQLDLFSTSARQRRLEVALDDLAARFGPDVVHRANELVQPSEMRLAAYP